MNTILLVGIAILLLLVLGFLIVLYVQNRKPKEVVGIDPNMALMMEQINQINRTIDAKIGESQKQMADVSTAQFGRSQQLIQDIHKSVTDQLVTMTKGVTEVSESTKQVFTIAEQLHSLEKVLKNQKQRGNLGEASLSLVFSNILSPTDYEFQYAFKNGDTVDAIIKTPHGIIPVDAKFSLENYTRFVNESDESLKAVYEKEFKNDVKKRIDETSKYIKQEEGTLGFAFMYIPAEGIYYDLLVNEVGSGVTTRSLIDYAYNEKKVIIVSPTTFAAYLQSVLHGFNAFKIAQGAEQIQKHVRELGKHLKTYEEYHNKLGKNLGTVVNQYNISNKEFKKIDKDILRISESSANLDPLSIEETIKVDED